MAATAPATAPAALPPIPPLVAQQIQFATYCFTGAEFPACAFANPQQAEKLFGAYELKTTFYDAQGQAVPRAQRPGRYGAVVEIHHAGRTSRRFVTLCRVDDGRNASQVTQAPADRFTPALPLDAYRAILCAGMDELKPDGQTVPENALRELDRQWWVNFKRQLYGTAKRYPQAFVCPRPLDGPAAPVLRPGTLAEAGMKPEAIERIDAACRHWVQTNGVGFSLCVVRRGVVVLNKGYGTIAQGPDKDLAYTPQTAGPLASCTKFLSAILMLEFIDQGLVNFDDPIDRYLPTLAGLSNPRPPTIRDLYLHTAGFAGHWGDWMPDMEELVADLYPALHSGAPHQYQGVGHALGGKVMESISGQCLPQLYRRHLIEPLGCTRTALQQSSYGSFATAEDLAIIGQMVLNGGSYGTMRFFSPRAVQQMKPIPGKDRFDPDRAIRWGVGCKLQDSDGWSDQAVGHSGASGSFLYVDPAYDMVIAHSRFAEGGNYKSFLQEKANTIRTIMQQVADR